MEEGTPDTPRTKGEESTPGEHITVWECGVCTYYNTNLHATCCEVCFSYRDSKSTCKQGVTDTAPMLRHISEKELQESKGRGIYFSLMPMLLSMTFDSPKEYWDMLNWKELERFVDTPTELEQLNVLSVCYGLDCLNVLVSELNALELERSAAILDVGCGNGHLCEVLHILQFTNITGIDFSSAALALARQVRKMHCGGEATGASRWLTKEPDDEGVHSKKTKEAEAKEPKCALFDPVEYIEGDILENDFLDDTFDVVIDKGTLDSIGMVSSVLSIEKEGTDKLAAEEEDFEDDTPSWKRPSNKEYLFADQVFRILRPGGYFFAVSCTHSVDELHRLFFQEDENEREEETRESEEEQCCMVVHKELTQAFEDLRFVIFKKEEIMKKPPG